MEDFSYIMIKPDAMKKSVIQDYIFQLLDEYELEITRQTFVKMTAQKIIKIWPNTLKDPMRFYLQKIYLGQCNMKIFEVYGNKAITKVHAIKKKIRRNYGKNMLINCIHAPTSNDEYFNDMKYIYENLIDYPIKFETLIDSNFGHRYSLLTEDDFWYSSICLWNFLESFSIEQVNDIYTAIAKQYGCIAVFLLNDNYNQLNYVISIIYEYFQEWSFAKAYFVGFATNQIGKFPVFFSKSLEKCKQVIDYFKKFNITMGYESYL